MLRPKLCTHYKVSNVYRHTVRTQLCYIIIVIQRINYMLPSDCTGCLQKMVRFQKLTRNLFLTLHGHNVHRQQRQLSKFLMRYQQFAPHA